MSQYDELILHMHACADGLHEAGELGCRGPQLSRDDFNTFTLNDKLLIRLPSSSVQASVYRVYDGEGEREER